MVMFFKDVQKKFDEFKHDLKKWFKEHGSKMAIILGLGIALGAGLGTTHISSMVTTWGMNPQLQSSFTFNNNQFGSPFSGINFTFGKIGETYFVPEVAVAGNGYSFSMLAEDAQNLTDASFSVSGTHLIYDNEDDNIQHEVYLQSYSCNTEAILGGCSAQYEYQIIVNTHTTDTYWFDTTSSNLTWEYEGNQVNFLYTSTTVPTTTVFSIGEIVITDNNNNSTSGQIVFDPQPSGPKWKIQVDPTWSENATFPITIDPVITISTGTSGSVQSVNNLTRTSDGTIFVCYSLTATKEVIVGRSKNNGYTWTTSSVTIDENAPGSCTIVSDSNDKLYLVYDNFDSITANLALYFSTSSNGINWSPTTTISDTSYMAYQEQLAIDQNNNLHLAYYQEDGGYYGRITYKKYDGSSWTSPIYFTDSNYSAFDPSIAVDSNNYIHLVYDSVTSTCDWVAIWHTYYNGSSWSAPYDVSQACAENITYPKIATDNSGNVHLTFIGNYPNVSGPEIIYTKWNGSSWSATTSLDSGDNNYKNPDIAVNRNGDIYIVYGYRVLSSNKYNMAFVKYNGSSWSTPVALTSYSSFSVYYPSILNSLYPSRVNMADDGFMFSYFSGGADYTLYGYVSSTLEWYHPGTIYDFSASTSTLRRAYYGMEDSVSTSPIFSISAVLPPSPTGSSWRIKPRTEFTASMYAGIEDIDDLYATTGTSSHPIYVWNFPQVINDYEIDVPTDPSTMTTSTWNWQGYVTGITSTDASATRAMDVHMLILDQTTNSWAMGAKKLDGACSSTVSECTMTYSSTTNLTKYFKASSTNPGYWTTRFAIVGMEIYSDCYNLIGTTTKMLCGKTYETTTWPGEGLNAIGCWPQSDTEDIWNQCPTGGINNPTTGCLTGNCAGMFQSPFRCGSYTDSAQHNCPQCYGCSSNPNFTGACAAQTTNADSGLFGCTGDCYKCSAGTCESSSCQGLQCGCSTGYICSSGSCVPSFPATCAIACGGVGTCYPNVPACIGAGGSPDGFSQDCSAPSLCCCGI